MRKHSIKSADFLPFELQSRIFLCITQFKHEHNKGSMHTKQYQQAQCFYASLIKVPVQGGLLVTWQSRTNINRLVYMCSILLQYAHLSEQQKKPRVHVWWYRVLLKIIIILLGGAAQSLFLTKITPSSSAWRHAQETRILKT